VGTGVAALFGVVLVGLAAGRADAGSCDTRVAMPSCLSVKTSQPSFWSRRAGVIHEWTVQNSCPGEQRFVSSRLAGGWQEHFVRRDAKITGRYMIEGYASDVSGSPQQFQCCKKTGYACMTSRQISHDRYQRQQKQVREYHRRKEYQQRYGR
jgi:hypothetical protein